MKGITLTQGKVSIADDWHYSYLRCYKWRAMKASNGRTWYAYTGQHRDGTRETMQSMIMRVRNISALSENHVIDHIDQDGLNNLESNLRWVTKVQNHINSRLAVNNTSGRKGASFHTVKGKWQATYGSGPGCILGYFDTMEEAAAAHDKAEAEAWFLESSSNLYVNGERPILNCFVK